LLALSGYEALVDSRLASALSLDLVDLLLASWAWDGSVLIGADP
jgi:hypothetical protein